MGDLRPRQLIAAVLVQVGIGALAATDAIAQQPSTRPPVTMAPAEMVRILQQPITSYAARETLAPPAFRERLAALRAAVDKANARFTVGYTTASEIPLSLLAGTRIPRSQPGIAQSVNQRAAALRKFDLLSAKQAKVAVVQPTPQQCSPSASSFDWRRLGKVTPVRRQICGTCWDFTALGAYEASFAIRNNQLIAASEQYILNCSGAGTCAGGWWMPVFDYMITHGTAREQDDQFTGNDSQVCPTGIQTPYRAASWGFVANDISVIPSPSAIKQALCEHGPLATAVYVDEAFQNYTGGIFDEHSQSFDWINHGIVIIGWDDAKQAWLIKNSWWTGWGETGGFGNENGYMWISYNTNNVGIATAWVDAASTSYTLGPSWTNVLKRLGAEVQPLSKP